MSQVAHHWQLSSPMRLLSDRVVQSSLQWFKVALNFVRWSSSPLTMQPLVSFMRFTEVLWHLQNFPIWWMSSHLDHALSLRSAVGTMTASSLGSQHLF